jgi:hypothetical protein
VLLGWRETTIDVDIRLEPEQDAILRELPRLKNDLRLNVELASPADFIPLPAGWEERSIFVSRARRLTVRHLDAYSQALAKLARNHELDRVDVHELLTRGYVERGALWSRFEEIEPQLYRFPGLDPALFRRNVRAVAGRADA